MHHVYIIESASGRWYIGYTKNMHQRLHQHNTGASSFTAHGKQWILIYAESYLNKIDALGREKFLKSGSGWKFLKRQLKNYLHEKSTI